MLHPSPTREVPPPSPSQKQCHGQGLSVLDCTRDLPASHSALGFHPLLPAVPCSANHNCLSPRPHDLQEAALVEEATLPRPLESCRAQEKAERLNGEH